MGFFSDIPIIGEALNAGGKFVVNLLRGGSDEPTTDQELRDQKEADRIIKAIEAQTAVGKVEGFAENIKRELPMEPLSKPKDIRSKSTNILFRMVNAAGTDKRVAAVKKHLQMVKSGSIDYTNYAGEVTQPTGKSPRYTKAPTAIGTG